MRSFWNKIHLYLKSLRLRVILTILAVGIVPALVISAGFLRLYESRAVYRDSTDIISTASTVTNRVVSSGYLADTSDADTTLVMRAYAKANSGRVLIINNALKIVKDTYGVDEGKVILWANVTEALKGESSYYYDKTDDILTVVVPIYEKSGDSTPIGAMLVSRDENHITSNLEYLEYVLALVLFVDVILSTVIAVIASTRYAAPIRQLTRKLDVGKKIQPSEKVIRRYTEVSDLSDAIDGFSQKMRDVDESRQQFVSNVSHELKTPLAAMKVLADSLNGQENVPVEIYKDFMLDIADEIDRENKIIGDLLALVKMDRSEQNLSVTPINMNELLERLLKRISPLAEKAGVELVLESFRPVIVEVDEVRFSLAVTNLVENAVKYNRSEGGWVHISLNSDFEYCYIKVEDNGIGIPEADIPHIFERFYRVDKSHSREIGGTGLGLAITYDAVMAHRGDIRVTSTEDGGTTFDVRVPLKYIKQ